MSMLGLLHNHLRKSCPSIHATRLKSLITVAEGLERCSSMCLTTIGRSLGGQVRMKSNVKKVDGVLGNGKLTSESFLIYQSLSGTLLSTIAANEMLPIIIDLCHIKDDRQIQMLSAELCNKGRSIPLYRDVFKEGGLKKRAKQFIEELSTCVPKNREVIIIMDAGFFEDWFQAIESKGWNWICRIRKGRSFFIESTQSWFIAEDFFKTVNNKIKEDSSVLLTKRHRHPCRLVSKRKKLKGRHCKTKRGQISSRVASKRYSDGAREPWVLATNLPELFSSKKIINLYKKRMQIEESFRDSKSHQFGLSARYVRTKCITRWTTYMLLATIVQVMYWMMGVLASRQELYKIFQVNTEYNVKVFSDFYLGRLIFQYNQLHNIKYDKHKILTSILQEVMGCV